MFADCINKLHGGQEGQFSRGKKPAPGDCWAPFSLYRTSLLSTPSLTILFYPKILPLTINGRKKEKNEPAFKSASPTARPESLASAPLINSADSILYARPPRITESTSAGLRPNLLTSRQRIRKILSGRPGID